MKTLKDLEVKRNINTNLGFISKPLIFKDDLRALAIEWVKSFSERIKNNQRDCITAGGHPDLDSHIDDYNDYVKQKTLIVYEELKIRLMSG